MSEKQIKFSELTENKKKQLYRIKCKLGFHDWKCLDYSGYSSIVECRKCEKIHTIKHK
jgi:hypothetical protein